MFGAACENVEANQGGDCPHGRLGYVYGQRRCESQRHRRLNRNQRDYSRDYSKYSSVYPESRFECDRSNAKNQERVEDDVGDAENAGWILWTMNVSD